MEQYVIKGGVPLNGEVSIGGAKNAALGILAAAIMTDETVLIDNLPDVNDINVLIDAIDPWPISVSPHCMVTVPSRFSCIRLEAVSKEMGYTPFGGNKVAEPMPRTAIRLRDMLGRLPLLE